MRLNKYDALQEVAMLYDENEALKRELRSREEAIARMESGSVIDAELVTVSAIDQRAIEIGRKRIFEDCTYSWQRVEAHRDEDGCIRVTGYGKFVKGFIHDIPAYMSRDDFESYFADELHAEYEKKKAEAIEKLQGDE